MGNPASSSAVSPGGLRFDRPLRGVPAVVERHRIAIDREEYAMDAIAAAVEHLSKGNSNPLRLFLGNRVPRRITLEAADRPFQARTSALGGRG